MVVFFRGAGWAGRIRSFQFIDSLSMGHTFDVTAAGGGSSNTRMNIPLKRRRWRRLGSSLYTSFTIFLFLANQLWSAGSILIVLFPIDSENQTQKKAWGEEEHEVNTRDRERKGQNERILLSAPFSRYSYCFHVEWTWPIDELSYRSRPVDDVCHWKHKMCAVRPSQNTNVLSWRRFY